MGAVSLGTTRPGFQSARERIVTDLTAQDIMARSEATLSPELDIYEAMQQLLKGRLTGAPVVGEDHRLIGMLTERDCLKVLVGGVMDGLPAGQVSDYMTVPAESVRPSTSLVDIVHVFLARSFRKLPVVDENAVVVGQVSRRDALVALNSLAESPSRDRDIYPVTESSGVDSAMRIALRSGAAST